MANNISGTLKEILNQLNIKNRTRLSNEAGCFDYAVITVLD